MSFDAGVRHTVFKISYLDYAGELLESEQEAGSTALSDLESRIQNAHGLLGVLDGYRVLQYLRNEPAGRMYFRSQIEPMTGIMAGASCPIHFVLTKWDLVRDLGEPADADENTRLDLVRDALLETAHLRALVETHTWGSRVIRLRHRHPPSPQGSPRPRAREARDRRRRDLGGEPDRPDPGVHPGARSA